MPTPREETDLHEHILGDLLDPQKFWKLLVDAIEHTSLEPSDVFTTNELNRNNWFDPDDIAEHFSPEEIFSEKRLSDWARDNGWKLDD